MDGTLGNPESYPVHNIGPKSPGLVLVGLSLSTTSLVFLISQVKKNYLGPDEKLYTVGAQVLEEGGGVSDQDPNQRLLWDRIDRGVELSVINKGEAVPERIEVKCDN